MEFYAVRKPESENGELYHHGIKGQKWGIRRFQNPDGTWKFAGKKRRRLSADAQARADRKTEIKNLKSKSDLDTAKASYKVTKERNKQAVKAAKADTTSIGKKIKGAVKDQIEKKKAQKKEATADEIIRSGDLNKVIKNKDKLTNEQLNDAIRRMELEQKLSDVSAKKKQNGVDAYKRFADTVSTTANLTTNGIKIYNNVASVLNTFTDADLMIIKTNKEGGGEAGRMIGDAARRASEAAQRTASNSSSSTSNSRQSASNTSSESLRTGEDRSEQTARRTEASSSSASNNTSMPSAGARQRAADGFREWRENTTPPRTVVEGTGTSRRSAESTVDRHSRERASAVDVEGRSMVENEIMPYVNDARFRRRS